MRTCLHGFWDGLNETATSIGRDSIDGQGLVLNRFFHKTVQGDSQPGCSNSSLRMKIRIDADIEAARKRFFGFLPALSTPVQVIIHRVMKSGSSHPAYRPWILYQQRICSEQQNAFGDGLGNKDAIEGVFVQWWQTFYGKGMLAGDG